MDEVSPFDRIPASIGALFLLAMFGWFSHSHAPISYFFLTALAATFALTFAIRRRPVPAGDRPTSARILDNLLADTRRVALWLSVGYGLVWLAQILLNAVRSSTRPEQASAVELHLYDLGERLDRLSSPLALLALLVAAIALSALSGGLGPLRALGPLRKTVNASTVILAAVGTFTFTTTGPLARRHELTLPPVRAAIAADIHALASARQRHAALQWMSAEFGRPENSKPEALQAWRDYFAAARWACQEEASRIAARDHVRETFAREAGVRPLYPPSLLDRPDAVPCDPNADLPAIGGQRAVPSRASSDSDPASWVPEYASWLEVWRGSPAAAPPSQRRLGDLARLGDRVRRERALAEAAAESARDVVVEAMAGLIGEDARGPAGALVNAWRDTVVEAMAAEPVARIGQRLALLPLRLTRFFSPPPALTALLAPGFPIEPPHGADQPPEAIATADAAQSARRTSPPPSPSVQPRGNPTGIGKARSGRKG